MKRSFLVLLLGATLLAQRDREPKVQPAEVDFGVVRVGAVLEGDVHVYWYRPAKGLEAKATLPKAVRQLELRSYKWDPGQTRSTFAFALSSIATGRHEEKVEVALGDSRAHFTVRWTVEPAIPGGSRVLVAESPFVGDSTDDSKQFDAWRRLVERARLDLDYYCRRKRVETFTTEALARVDVVLAAESALSSLTKGEAARLQGFVCGGGRVVVFANRFFGGSVLGANKITEPFGLLMVDREPPPGGQHTAGDEELPKHPLTAGVESVTVRRPSPTVIMETEMARPLVMLPALGEVPFAAIATTKSGGECVTVGVSLWWLWMTRAPGNERLLRNLLVRAPRQR